jgi:hypothetical protein
MATYRFFKDGIDYNFVCFFKFHLVVGVEVSIVNALYWLRITDQLFESDVLHDRLFNAC